MIRKFNQYIKEDYSDSEHLLYYAFDWDDNILNMPTKIHMEHLVDGEWVPTKVSTAEFAEVRNDKNNWRIDYDVAFIEFRDQGERGDLAFLEDVKSAISEGKFGPAWDDFIECLSNGSLFAIITARGHESEAMRMGIEWIIDNVLTEEQVYSMYNHLMKYAYHFGDNNGSYDRILKGQPSKNKLVQEYLDNCEFVGVSSPSRGGSPDNPEKAKEDALLAFQDKVNDYAERLGKKAKIGFSDDDLKNVKHIEDLYSNLHKERFPNIIQFSVKGTKDPQNITKTVRTMESKIKNFTNFLNETSHQTPGLESSVLTSTQFGNQAGRLNPQGPLNRQDDFYNQFRRQVNYLSKNSKEILKKSKKSSK
jgi:hypothetical protein